MIGAFFFGFIALIILIVLFILKTDSAENENVTNGTTVHQTRWDRLREYGNTAAKSRKPPVVSKELILAMAQRGVYALKNEDKDIGDGCEDVQFAQQIIDSVCAKLDEYQPIVMKLLPMVNLFCDRLEKVIDMYQVNLCNYSIMLCQITRERLSIEKEIFRTCNNDQYQQMYAKGECSRNRKPLLVKSKRCLNDNDDDVKIYTDGNELLSTYEQFVADNLTLRTYIDCN